LELENMLVQIIIEKELFVEWIVSSEVQL